MKRKILLFLAILTMLLTCSCDSATKTEGVIRVTISTLPEIDDYERVYTSSEKIRIVTDYIDKLDLASDFEENPDEYMGMTYVITYTFADGSERTMFHFGNLFFKTEDEEWQRMTDYNQSQELENIIKEQESDE